MALLLTTVGVVVLVLVWLSIVFGEQIHYIVRQERWRAHHPATQTDDTGALSAP